MIRLDKFLSEMGAGTRQEVKQYIRKGKVEVDGEIEKRPELKVDETKANVTLDGERIGYASYVYYMLNKPSGVVSATEDKREKTVIDLIKGQKRKDLFPVGRLDKDTVGLLLIQMMEIWHTGYFLRNIMWINAILQKCRGTLQKMMRKNLQKV